MKEGECNSDSDVPYQSARIYDQGKLAFRCGCGRIITTHKGYRRIKCQRYS